MRYMTLIWLTAFVMLSAKSNCQLTPTELRKILFITEENKFLKYQLETTESLLDNTKEITTQKDSIISNLNKMVEIQTDTNVDLMKQNQKLIKSNKTKNKLHWAFFLGGVAVPIIAKSIPLFP